MDRITFKKQVLSTLIPLLLAGCATHSSETRPVAAPGADGGAAISRDPNLPRAQTDTASAEAARSAEADGPGAATGLPQNYPDLWSRLRAGFALSPLEGSVVEQNEQWFANNPEFMQAMMERARLYLYYIVEEVEKRGLPTEIALLPAIESAYKPYAYSRARASGLWQFMAPTGRLYGLKMNWWVDGRRDVEAATQAALDYLQKLHNEFNGDWHLALAAYNAGEGKVGRMMELNRRKGLPTSYTHLKLKRETRNYVPRLQAMANIVANPQKYGVQLADIQNKPYFTRVETGSQIDLGIVAKLTDMPLDDLQKINPGLNRWATDPEGPHTLLVPVEKKDALVAGLNNLPAEERVQSRSHEVKRGDTMHDVARRYGVTPETVRSANGVKGNILQVGQNLMIPLSTRALMPVIAGNPNRAVTRVAANGVQPVVHRVRAGETLWSIARRYGVLVSQIVHWNLLETSDVLQLGQRLKIWTGGGPSAAIGSPNG